MYNYYTITAQCTSNFNERKAYPDGTMYILTSDVGCSLAQSVN